MSDLPATTAEFGFEARPLRLRYQTPADPTLPHQVVFQTLNGGNGNPCVVTCNCRVRVGKTHIGFSNDLSTARDLYNNPRHHVGQPFGPEDVAKW